MAHFSSVRALNIKLKGAVRKVFSFRFTAINYNITQGIIKSSGLRPTGLYSFNENLVEEP